MSRKNHLICCRVPPREVITRTRTAACWRDQTTRPAPPDVFAKIGARDRAHAVVFAYESGHIHPGKLNGR